MDFQFSTPTSSLNTTMSINCKKRLADITITRQMSTLTRYNFKTKILLEQQER